MQYFEARKKIHAADPSDSSDETLLAHQIHLIKQNVVSMCAMPLHVQDRRISRGPTAWSGPAPQPQPHVRGDVGL